MTDLVLCAVLTALMLLCFGLSACNSVRDILNGSEHSFFYLLFHDHPVGLTFGIVLLIWICTWDLFAGSVYALRDIRPACGKPRFSAAEVDAQAEHPDTVWLPACNVFAAPDMLIGTSCGITAVDYSDIAEVRLTSRTHTRLRGRATMPPPFQKRHYIKYVVSRITVITKEHKRLYIAKGTATADIPELKRLLMEKCGGILWDDKR